MCFHFHIYVFSDVFLLDMSYCMQTSCSTMPMLQLQYIYKYVQDGLLYITMILNIHTFLRFNLWLSARCAEINYSKNKTLGRALDLRANGAWLSKLTE